MNPVQYIILNKGAGMSTGKAAAQAAHASVEGVRRSAKAPGGNPWDSSIVNLWMRGGHYTKIVLEVADADALYVARDYIVERDIKVALIIDEGRTEFDGLTPTALGSEIVNKDSEHVRAVFSEFKLYSDTPKVLIIENAKKIHPEVLAQARKKIKAGDIAGGKKMIEYNSPPRAKGEPLWRYLLGLKPKEKGDAE